MAVVLSTVWCELRSLTPARLSAPRHAFVALNRPARVNPAAQTEKMKMKRDLELQAKYLLALKESKQECKSLNHTYSVGDQAFDLTSKQVVTIAKIVLVFDSTDSADSEKEYQSMNFGAYENGDDDFFVVIVDPPDEHNGHLNVGEFCLPEEAERYRGFSCIPSAEFEAKVKTFGWPT
jgi:hypothetical protein